MDQLINQVLHDRYRIQSLIGRSTGRRTFLANDLQTESSVVIKLLLFGPDFTWDDLKLFEREAEVLKSLQHPAIPEYLDFFEVETDLGKGFALVQTYIEARSLQDWLQSGRTFGEDEVKALAKELLQILDYLHSRQPAVIHRDIKPSNILLANRSGHSPGQVYLVDFGSVQTALHGGTNTIVGTYGYMPPEQFGGQTKPASDLYALGATLIYLATGRHPNELPQKEMRILFEPVNLNPALIDWLKWMTEPSLDLRLESATLALEALEKSNLRASNLAATKPIGSKVRVTKTREKLEILIPPQGFHLELVFTIAFAIVWNSCLVIGCIAVITGNPLGLCFAIFAFRDLVARLPITWGIVFTLFGQTRLRINLHSLSLTHEIFGFECSPSRIAFRQDIAKLEFTPLSYKKDSKGGNVAVPPQINIWAGIEKLELGAAGRLTNPELHWLAEELSSWLNLPITRD